MTSFSASPMSAELVSTDAPTRTPSELHAMTFLARYSNVRTREGYAYVTFSLDCGRSERDVAASVGHSDTRLVSYYDRARDSIARNTTHQVAGYIEGAL